MMSKQKKKKILFMASYVLIACIFVYLLKPVYLVSIFIVLVPPSIANFLWLKESRFKIFIFSLLTTILFAPPVEIMARLANSWDVQSILPRLFGIAPLENMLFAFINFFWVLSFYQYFIEEKEENRKISRRFIYLIALYVLLSAIVYTLLFISPDIISLDYHLIALLILIVPGIIIFYKRFSLLKKTWLPTLFFAYVFFVYEFVAMLIGNWWWPGDYLFTINFFGQVFPLDDVVIWYFLSTPVLIGGYKFFVDKDK